ncbi:hypothetical protein OROHE_010319 [Orobanche hederae]
MGEFHCLAENEELTFRSKIEGGAGELPVDFDITKDVVFVGSSYGWLALYNRRNSDLFLTNPNRRSTHKASVPAQFRNSRSRDPLLLHRRRRRRWASRLHDFWSSPSTGFLLAAPQQRMDYLRWRKYRPRPRIREFHLGCRSTSTSSARLDRVIRNKRKLDFYKDLFSWPERTEVKECFQMKYLISHDDDSDELFLVVRHVSLRAGPFSSMVNKVTLLKYRGCHYSKTPYKTIDFDVYKFDFELVMVMHMKDSLQGLAMFFGSNQPFAIPAADVAGLKPDSVYFTDDNSIFEPTRLERTSYGGHDNGIFDYQNYPIEFEKIRKILPLPMWFRY